MAINPASVGGAVDESVASTVPLVDAAPADQLPTLPDNTVPGLPTELQPQPGDILLQQLTWPWSDLGARSVPESWLYMSRKVQGVIAQLAVQTSVGPKLVKANPDGTIVQQTAPNSPVVPNYQDDSAATTFHPVRTYYPTNVLDAVNLGAASTTSLIAVDGAHKLQLGRVMISSNVGVTNKVILIFNTIDYYTVILPPNSAPHIVDFGPYGGQGLPGKGLSIYTDNAGLFGVTVWSIQDPV